MRKDYAILPIVIVLFGSFFISDRVLAKILISRVQIAGSSTTDEYVELYNFASSSENIAGWSLKKLTSSGTTSNLITSFAENTVLPPFSYYLIGHRDYMGEPDLRYSSASVSLAANNSVLITDQSGETVDRVEWGEISAPATTPASNPGTNQNLTRLPDEDTGNWVDSENNQTDFFLGLTQPRNSFSTPRPYATSTPDEANPISTTTPSSFSYDWDSVRINEFVSNPETGNEWIELYNSSSSTILIEGGKICDNRDISTCEIYSLTETIAPLEFKIFEITSSKLNNDGDSVILFDQNENIIDRADYGGNFVAQKGESIARSVDGNGDWKITTSPTPGAANQIITPILPQSQNISVGGGGGTVNYFSSDQKILSNNNILTPVTLIWNLNVPKVTTINTSTFFDSHLTADPRGGDILYSWNFGSNAVQDGSRIYHTFTSSGLYTIVVNGTSSQGTIGSKSFELRVLADFHNKSLVFIDSVLAKPDIGEEEWVALQNQSTSSIDIGGWSITDQNQKTYLIPEKTVFKPFSILRFYRPVTKLTLGDDGGTLYLTNNKGEVVDSFEYGRTKRGEPNYYVQNLETKPTEPTSTGLVLGEKIIAQKENAIKNNYSTISLTTARLAPENKYLKVCGSIISLPGKPYANYFYIADSTAGLQIYSYKKLFPIIAIGDLVCVNGEKSFSAKVPRLKISTATAITLVEHSDENIPLRINSTDTNNNFGKLISIEGEVTDLSSNYFYLDDKKGEIVISLAAGAGIDKSFLIVGGKYRVTGILENTETGIKIFPRQSSDIVLIESVQTQTSTPKSKQGWLAGGGVVLVLLAGITKFWILKK